MKNELTAKRIRRAMNAINIKAQELADRSGLNKASISQYVNGKCIPNSKSAGKIASILGVSPAWLMGFDVPMYDNELFKYENVQPIDAQTFRVLGISGGLCLIQPKFRIIHNVAY